MKLGYADPPYFGCGKLYAEHHPDALDWDEPATHARLIERLQDEFDGWVIHASATAARLIRAAWREPKRRHVARFILVALYTGTRAGAICGAALRPTTGRGWIDAERGVFYRRPAGKRESKKRQPPIPLHGRLLAHIRRWIRRRVAIDNLVEFEGEAVLSVRKGFAGAVADAGLEGKVTPHVLRHTSATWLMQGGADLLEAARLLGMTPQMLLDTYGHHHPGHLQGALKAFDKGKSGRHSLNGTKNEQASSNVRKLADKY